MDDPIRVAAIVAAGGRGARFGARGPKQLEDLGGCTILERSLGAFVAVDQVREIVAVLPADLAADPPAFLTGLGRPVRTVAGGARRQDSVAAGFDSLTAEAAVIVVHDAARPLVTPALIARTIEAALRTGAAIAALRAHDTVKRATSGEPRFVDTTLDRGSIYLAQTPQAFRREVLRDAIALGRRGAEATDEAALAEQAGYRVEVVEGESRNLKITTPEDLTVARAILSGGSSAGHIRIGVGYDLHRLVEGRPLVLGGVTVPFDRGLAGHSDADALSHAVTDAVLGAIGAGDIGRHFPDTDPAWKDADSLVLLGRAAGILRERGWIVENVDAVVIAEHPRIAPYAPVMAERLACALGVPADCVSVKGKTNEGIDAPGRGEAIAAHAVALVRRVP